MAELRSVNSDVDQEIPDLSHLAVALGSCMRREVEVEAKTLDAGSSGPLACPTPLACRILQRWTWRVCKGPRDPCLRPFCWNPALSCWTLVLVHPEQAGIAKDAAPLWGNANADCNLHCDARSSVSAPPLRSPSISTDPELCSSSPVVRVSLAVAKQPPNPRP
ncbi:hypothetical protein QBC41DRAFT_299964 [Cercophora samala]|uniref:Uncharacterized protein n=1 Tax=Cercophora samala TaxID=330535 RepID=A0AA39ZJ14_9PEZI|nr:hypothetical protein QBC41DRAFT_299964 [Cercophora samala]